MPTADIARVALITGCSSGIGQATAHRLARAGWRVYATARRVETLQPLEAVGCRALALDVADERSMQAAIETITREAGGIGALVNNAGYSQSGPIELVGPSLVRRQFETNVFGPLRLTQLVLPGMRARRQGRIVNIGSMGGRLTFPGGGVYHATKHALEAISDALRFEVAGFGIQVVLVQPGLIRTSFTSAASASLEGLGAGKPGPYGHFTTEVERITRESYVKGPIASLAGTPEGTAGVIERALTVKDPRARYRVTASASVLMSLRALLPDSLWDAFLARTYPRAGPAEGGHAIARTVYCPAVSRRIAVEFDTHRKIRTRNKLYYRWLHWPIWIFVFFIAPGPLTFDLFERGFDLRMALWLGVVIVATGIPFLRGRLPGCEPAPYIIRFTEDRPNPVYRRICYSIAWGEAITFAVLNIIGLLVAISTGTWMLKEIYRTAYFPMAGLIWAIGLAGHMPRVKPSTAGEGHERRYFYGTVWAVAVAQTVLWFLYLTMPKGPSPDTFKLLAFVGVLTAMGWRAYQGKLPRTRPIVPGELAALD